VTVDEHLHRIVAGAVEEAVARQFRTLAELVATVAPLTYKAEEAAVVIGVCDKTVRELVREGVLPVVPHLGNRVLIPRAAVEAFVAQAEPRARLREVAS
jgi:excisionase family DNA binding protein